MIAGQLRRCWATENVLPRLHTHTYIYSPPLIQLALMLAGAFPLLCKLFSVGGRLGCPVHFSFVSLSLSLSRGGRESGGKRIKTRHANNYGNIVVNYLLFWPAVKSLRAQGAAPAPSNYRMAPVRVVPSELFVSIYFYI